MSTLYSYLIINGGGPGSGCHGPNCGRKPSHSSYGFVSPNTEENINLISDAIWTHWNRYNRA